MLRINERPFARRVALSGRAEAERVSDLGRALDVRSRAHDDRDPAEVCGLAGDWVNQGDECNPLASGWLECTERARETLSDSISR